jgi:hypothetical protein
MQHPHKMPEVGSIPSTLTKPYFFNLVSNIQHSSCTDQWFTPKWLIDKVRQVIPQIDLDPASCDLANQIVKATKYLTETDDALQLPNWSNVPVSVFCNSPTGKYIGNISKSKLFWEKLLQHKHRNLLKEAIFLGFSLEQLQTTQNCVNGAIGDYPICVPSKRVKFVSPKGVFNSPTHSNVIVYIPGVEDNTELFYQIFKNVGSLLQPYK